MVPTESPADDQARPDSGPLTTRIVGELPPLDEPRTPAHPEPEQLEVTQPYIPAIREKPPEFAKRLNPDRSPAGTGQDRQATETTTAAEPAAETTQTPTPPPSAEPHSTPVETQHIAADTIARPPEPARTEPARTEPAPAGKRRSLARRVVRRIIGPDLLRKDPAPKRR
ncbi:hypothetical protein [Haloactinomyces albus]|uniref:Uncharacterized protein n=1 Tax=Haloactinomyces albus TaxID=1352928 RepID=A0AAE3ZAZ1_9ACTN|nr:hypothetical protein [Haloactinomyces albus]MDR7299887.1 hypothetical protein [Haloactinomyces albus]